VERTQRWISRRGASTEHLSVVYLVCYKHPLSIFLLALSRMSSTVDIASSFIEGTPPGELSDVVNDVKTLTSDKDPALVSKLKPAFERYNEEQLTAVKLPGSIRPVGSERLPFLSCADVP
jgi:hypothetical protein